MFSDVFANLSSDFLVQYMTVLLNCIKTGVRQKYTNERGRSPKVGLHLLKKLVTNEVRKVEGCKPVITLATLFPHAEGRSSLDTNLFSNYQTMYSISLCTVYPCTSQSKQLREQVLSFIYFACTVNQFSYIDDHYEAQLNILSATHHRETNSLILIVPNSLPCQRLRM